jgi:prophage antirepressor-like protein
MSDLSVFVFESQKVRFVGTPEKPEWVAADVCAILEIKNVSDALTPFVFIERGIATAYTPGDDNPQGQEMLTVTEAGLYRLIFKSRKPVAKRFQRWVFHEVLPSLRRTGKYEMPKPDQQQNNKPTLDEDDFDEEEESLPVACVGCQNYHGVEYAGNMLICGIHAHGWDEENCPDFQIAAIPQIET